MSAPLKVAIVGAGLGGLAAAIACRHGGLKVTILERTAKIGNVGAGIQIPPNSGKTLNRLGVLSSIEKSSTVLESFDLRRYADGSLLIRRPLGETAIRLYGEHWRVIHREDYHAILLEEALRLGAKLQLDTQVEQVNASGTELIMADGSIMKADVVIGADGLWSSLRGSFVNKPSPPSETGELAYRATFARSQLEALNDPRVEELCGRKCVTLWLGPEKHCVFYPIRAGSSFNLVLTRPDNLPSGTRTAEGDLSEMRATFEGWDPMIQGNAALLGDACHPTLPYQAQGAAMAVEDGAALGYLLGAYQRDLQANDPRLLSAPIMQVLKLYEQMRKQRTTLNVAGANQNRSFYHLPDGREQEERDAEMAGFDFDRGRSSYVWLDSDYNKDLLSYDAVEDAAAIYQQWRERQLR
ncbi:hypothetical protein CERZMDRAFT_112698 [Cercospora zeae-maydis SCOH1-5]|uniref:FAD-binding domain-containing protein n=1 Tax=Cercospora zeae-maydis SCOH1-5 TaxID=717836 RepID=A0A6A6FCY5_9PEZI|nr:hypothetical protein CERZMDRAFT_112698 [Cercospora zeae-maydis SCOH1-5]